MTLWQRILFAIYAFLASLYGDVPPPEDETISERLKRL